MIAYLAETVEGQMLLKECPNLAGWWDDIRARRSLVATQFELMDYPWARRDTE